MSKFRIKTERTVIDTYLVEAEDVEEAIDLLESGVAEEGETYEYEGEEEVDDAVVIEVEVIE